MDRKPSTANTGRLVLPLAYFFFLSIGLICASSFLIISEGRKQADASDEISDVHIELSKNEPKEIKVIEKKVTDIRAKKINAFFAKFKNSKNGQVSPLATYGEVFVREADKNQIDWKLLPAIALHESAAGTSITAGGTNNPFGWGFNDDRSKNNDLINTHDSFEASIILVSKKMRQSYYDRGLISVDQIVTRYNPGSVARAGGKPENSTWTQTINGIMDKINNQDVE